AADSKKRSWVEFADMAKPAAAGAGAAAAGASRGGCPIARLVKPFGVASASASAARAPAAAAAPAGGGGAAAASSASRAAAPAAAAPASAASAPPASASRAASPAAAAAEDDDASDAGSDASTETVPDTPEVAAAREAKTEARNCVGLKTPKKDKGPPDPDAVCVLCPHRRGALLRAEKGARTGLPAWCHVLCAFSKGLVIRDRVVQTRGHVKGKAGEQCSCCHKGGGGLITCSHPDCSTLFHPLCGNRSGGSAVRGPHLHPRDWTARCSKHAEVSPPEGGGAEGGGGGGGEGGNGEAGGAMPVVQAYT
ncbi:unnamed protein product, partial [Laminaria digitata]